MSINPATTNVPHHIKTSQLICIANQLTGFYMMMNIGRYWVKCLNNANNKLIIQKLYVG